MSVTRVTTPTDRFRFPIDPDTFEIIRFYYGQRDDVYFIKNKEDCVIDGYIVKVTLTQEETKLFNERFPVKVQMRGLTYSGKALASKTFERPVKGVMSDELLE